MTKKKKAPNPGSREAVALGCICAVLDNHHGKGAYLDGKAFWVTGGCTLHDDSKVIKK